MLTPYQRQSVEKMTLSELKEEFSEVEKKLESVKEELKELETIKEATWEYKAFIQYCLTRHCGVIMRKQGIEWDKWGI